MGVIENKISIKKLENQSPQPEPVRPVVHYYNESPHIVGVWLDERPVYEVTLQFIPSQVGENPISPIDLIDSNFDFIIECQALYKMGDGSDNLHEVQVNYFNTSEDNYRVYVNDDIIYFHTTNANGKLYLTLRYVVKVGD